MFGNSTINPFSSLSSRKIYSGKKIHGQWGILYEMWRWRGKACSQVYKNQTTKCLEQSRTRMH